MLIISELMKYVIKATAASLRLSVNSARNKREFNDVLITTWGDNMSCISRLQLDRQEAKTCKWASIDGTHVLLTFCTPGLMFRLKNEPL